MPGAVPRYDGDLPTIGELRAHSALALALLRAVGISASAVSSVGYSSLEIADLRQMSYREEWRSYIEGGFYDIILQDQSLFQFKVFPHLGEGTLVSFSFMPTPHAVLSYERYVLEVLEVDGSDGDYIEFYDEYISMADVAQAVTPIRYDFAPSELGEAHPCGHIHIGRENQVRIGVSRMMNVSSFVLFVVRQAYPDAWRRYLQLLSSGDKDVLAVCKCVRHSLSPVPADLRLPCEVHELTLE